MKIKQRLSVMWPVLLYYFVAYNIAITALFFIGMWVVALRDGNWPFSFSGTLIIGVVCGTICFGNHVYGVLKK